MAKRICELCGKDHACDMWFGVHLCSSCEDKFDRAKEGDAWAINQFLDPQMYPYATDNARKNIIAFVKHKNKGKAEDAAQQKSVPHQAGCGYQQTTDADDTCAASNIYPEFDMRTTPENKNGARESWTFPLFANIGAIIKFVAILLWVCTTGGILMSGIVFLFLGGFYMVVAGVLMIHLAPVVGLIPAWLLYAYGELVDKTAANEENTRNILRLMQESKAKDHVK